MILYDSVNKTVTITGKNKSEVLDLYCGETIHPQALTLVSYSEGSLTLQEAFTALLLEQSKDHSFSQHHLVDAVEEMFGKGSWIKLEEDFLKRATEGVSSTVGEITTQSGLKLKCTKI